MEGSQFFISYGSVLDYWFGGDQQRNYKNKWFPSANDGIQQTTDAEINELFGSIFQDVSRTHESDTTNRHAWLLPSKETNNSSSGNYRSHLAYILLLDQFSRHIYRYQDLDKDDTKRKFADNLAVQATKSLIDYNEHWWHHYSSTEVVFALMPYRHSPTIPRLEYITSILDQKEARDREALELMNKFRKQTITRLQHLQDRQKAEEADSVLERVEFDGDDSDMAENRLTKATISFLRSQLSSSILNADNGGITSVPVVISLSGGTCIYHINILLYLYFVFFQYFNKPLFHLIVGVDSMVITRILVYLRRNNLLPIQKIVAVHIDYANRAESGVEADYVEGYCARHDVVFEKRIINEVTRGITDRDEYERVAREIRYSTYQQVLTTHGGQGVIFGHHLGDVQENVISNVMRGSNPLHLSGMTAVGVVNGVNVWRPLLAYPKDDIYDFAHKYGVPYFKDTTPSWSTRGTLRNQLVPLLISMYGTGCLHNLSALATASDELKSEVDEHIYGPLLRSVQRFPCGLKVCTVGYKNRSVSFWRETLKQLMHSMGMSLVREGAVQSLLDRLNPNNPPFQKSKKHIEKSTHSFTQARIDIYSDRVIDGWIELRKGFYSYITTDGYLVIFKDGVLFNRAQSADPRRRHRATVITTTSDTGSVLTGSSVRSTHPWTERFYFPVFPARSMTTQVQSFQLGVWTVRIEQVDSGSSDNTTTTGVKNLSDPSELLAGSFQYHISLPNVSRYTDVGLVVYGDFRDWRLQHSQLTSLPTNESSSSINRLSATTTIGTTVASLENTTSAMGHMNIHETSKIVDPVSDSELLTQVLYTDLHTTNSQHQYTDSSRAGYKASIPTYGQLIEEMLSVPALGQMDLRLRSSLPLLVPLVTTIRSADIHTDTATNTDVAESKSSSSRVQGSSDSLHLLVSYTYS